MGNVRLVLLSLLLAIGTGCIETEKSKEDEAKLNAIPIGAFESMSISSGGGGYLGGSLAAYRAELNFDSGHIQVTYYDGNFSDFECQLDSETMALIDELLTHKIYYKVFGPNEPEVCPGLVEAYGFHIGEESAMMHFCGDGYYYVDSMATSQLIFQITRNIEQICLPASSS